MQRCLTPEQTVLLSAWLVHDVHRSSGTPGSNRSAAKALVEESGRMVLLKNP